MITISNREAKEILISVIAISVALAINVIGVGAVLGDMQGFVMFTAFFLVALGSGFILHEMAHKFTAIHFGHLAEFRMWTKGLIFMFILAILPTTIVFIAPGAVYIGGGMRRITVKENGIISLAGPAMNIILAFVALGILAILGPIMVGDSGMELWSSVALINIFLALFNMIPIFPLDGSKVFRWSKAIYGGCAICIILLYFFLSDIIQLLVI